MRKIYFLFFIALMAIEFGARAERINIPGLNVPKLIITEVRPDAEATAYVEITNLGDTAIDLEPFTLHSVFYNTRCQEYSDSVISFNRANDAVDSQIGKIYLKGVLQPGESYVVANVWDQKNSRGLDIPVHNTAIAQIGKQFAHRDESLNQDGWINKPEWQTFGRDSVSTGLHEFLRGAETAGYLLHWVFQTDSATVDSTYIDQFNHFYYPDENVAIGFNNSSKGPWIFPIAGVDDAITTSVMVRKANVTKGNLDWDQSRGTDASTSEWLVIPKNTSQDLAFNTVGIHGSVYDLDYTAKDPSTIVVDEGAATISVPWQIIRGDSLSRYFNLGDGMSWSYDMVGVFEDSASYIARPGDKFAFYAIGNEVKKKEYTLEVREADPDVALVFPRRILLFDEEIVIDEETGIEDTIVTRYWSTGFVYDLSEGPEIDSIINVPFATRTDSLLKYLDKPENANWEFVFVDGIDRVDLKFGDKLKVTSENGATVKEYFVAVDDHVQSNNALLSAVTWPDVDKNLYPRWDVGDTLPEFTPLKTSYIVELRQDARQIPAFQFIPQDLRAKIEVKNAVDIDGNRDQRTTSVTVTSESDTISMTYNFQFRKQNTPVQPYVAEPFISEFVHGITTQGWAVEIYNPGTEELDLSRYMYVAGEMSQTWQEAVQTVVSTTVQSGFTVGVGNKSYNTHYVPSKRWKADYSWEAWQQVPDEENPYVGAGFLRDDNQTDPWVKGQDVWVMGIGMNTNAFQTKIREESDFLFRGTGESAAAWDSLVLLHRETVIWNNPGHNMWLLKILNDSILDGTKDVRDPSAYELIDRWEIVGDSLAGRDGVAGMGWNMRRKPSVTKGNLERMGGGNETAESSEWIIHHVNDFDWNNNKAVEDLGIHTFNPVSNYLSTVTSLKLNVTPGYQGDNLSITGNITDYTPETIALVLDKADSTQTFVFKRGAAELADDENLAEGDVLEVTSGDGENTTIYTLINSPLDDDTSLTAKAGSSLAVTGNKVTGVTVGLKLRDVLSQLEVAEKSILNVFDASGALQPLAVHDLDSLVVDVLVNENIILQVVAENNDSESYTFDFGLGSGGAILLSNILAIDQSKKMIMELPENSTVASILSMIFANDGSTVRILDKAGNEREVGFLNVDDVIEVTSPDGARTVIYGLSGEGFVVSVNDRLESQTNVVIYPNPVKHVLNIEGFELASVQVYSITGTMMISETTSNSNRLDVSYLPHGIYVIRMTDVKGRIAVDKFLKK